MDDNTAGEFTQLLAVLLGSFADARNKITAFESAIKQHDPALHALYRHHLEMGERQDKTGTQVAVALEHLQRLLGR